MSQDHILKFTELKDFVKQMRGETAVKILSLKDDNQKKDIVKVKL